ncbi:SpoIIE family protein phosphatase [Thalassospira sp. MA62]|nr:SpoIIE family protein phosphatase [Thalassospira sp. MA62]
MLRGPDGRVVHSVAIAQTISAHDAELLLSSGNIWPDPDAVTIRQTIGNTPEDFPASTHFSCCLLPQHGARDWLSGLFRLDCDVFVESFDKLDLGDLGPLVRDTRTTQRELIVCLSTRSAYHLPVPRKFVTTLRHRGMLDDHIAPAVEMAVQEAFANSLIHGNLELDTGGHLSMNRFNALGEQTDQRLASSEFGDRTILLRARKRRNGQLCIQVSDQGKGFVPKSAKESTSLPGAETTFGRGLPLIRSLCHKVSFLRDGRTIELNFQREDTSFLTINPALDRGSDGNAVIGADTSPEFELGNPQNATILIADDTLLSREIIASYLRADGYTNLVFAKDGQDALDQIQAHNPDLIILDIIMPKLDGYAVCNIIRNDPAFAETPIIAQTALEENEGRTRIFDDGATDLILKPLNKAELIARTKIHLQNRMLVKQLRAYRERTQSELELARDMQQHLNPAPDQYRGAGFDYGLRISATFQMSSELGGDMWGLIPIDEHRIGVYIVDFAGHGLGAALNTFRLHSLIWSDQHRHREPGPYLENLNHHLKGLLPVGQYATMLYGMFDRQAGTFSYASAACPSPVLGDSQSGKARFLDGSGVPLGIVRNAQYETRQVSFDHNNFLLLYSDALIETTLDDGKFLSEENLLTMIGQTMQETGGDVDLAAHLADQFMDRAPARLSDDFTILSLQSDAPSGLSPFGNGQD